MPPRRDEDTADADRSTRDGARGPDAAPRAARCPTATSGASARPLLCFLLRMDTLRGAARVLSLLALDFAASSLAIFTALC